MSIDLNEQLNQHQKEYPILHDWFHYLLTHPNEGEKLWKLARRNEEYFEDLVFQLAEAVRLLPEQPIRFQDYSRIVSEDSQGLEPYKELGYFFLHALAEDARMNSEEDLILPTTESALHELYSRFNLIYNDVRDRVLVANLFAETAESYHPVWETAVHTESTLSVSIRELMEIETIYPAHEKPYVWIVEESRLFSSLLNEVPNVPMVCTEVDDYSYFAAKDLLDKIVEAGFQLKYAGELTPSGIVRAERWLMRYPEAMQPWKMDVESYLKSRLFDQELTSAEIELLNIYHLDIFACLKDEMRDQRTPAKLNDLFGEMVSELKYHYQ